MAIIVLNKLNTYKIINNKRAQAMVELLLLMVIMIPLTSMVILKTKSMLLVPISGWMKEEFQAQVRYGYSASELQAETAANFANIEGAVPQKYNNTPGSPFHPLQNVHSGWKP